MSNSAVSKGLEIFANGQNTEALRRLIVMTIFGRYLRPRSTNDVAKRADSLTVLLSRLPIKRLAEVTSISKGKTGIKDARRGIFPLVVTAEIRSSADHFDFEGPGVIIPMVSSTGHGDASLKRIHFQDGQYAVGSILAVVQPKDLSVLSARYLHAYLSSFKDELLVSRMVGTANVSLTVAKISDIQVPMLPIKGQEKIDDLMTLCDRLEVEQTDAEAAHARLVETLLGTLTQSTDAAELAANWQRLAEHFDSLFTTESSLDALKQTILQLAVMGKLVPQDPNDEPASELIKRIAKERARLEANGTYKKSKAIPLVEGEEQPFALPNSWAWIRFAHLDPEFQNGESSRGASLGKEVVVLRLADISNGAISLSDTRSMLLPESSVQKYQLKKGDLLVIRVNGSAEIVGRLILCAENLDAIYCDHFIRVRIKDTSVDRRFLRLIGDASAIRGQIQGLFITTAGQKTVNQGHIGGLVIPLPPLAEQHRIVAKVDELMALCDRLKTDLAESCARQARLSATLVESALQAA